MAKSDGPNPRGDCVQTCSEGHVEASIKTVATEMSFPPYISLLDAIRRQLISRRMEFGSIGSGTKVPVIILQMGKVSSTSLADAIRQTNNFCVYQIHLLNQESIEDRLRQCQKSRTYTFRHLIDSIFVKENIMGQSERLKVITITREPISRNISAFFQNILLYSPEFKHSKKAPFDSKRIIERFICSYIHDFPLNYFDREVKQPFGLDVYAYRFHADKGYQVIRGPHLDLLTMQFEVRESVKTHAICEFLGVPSISIPRLNRSEQKEYAVLYKQVLEEISLPEDYLDRMYNSKYAKHFYSPQQIQSFRARWSRNSNEGSF